MNTGQFHQKYQNKVDFKDNSSNSYLTYSVWRSILSRCQKDVTSYHYGISICDEWMNFDNFISDMGERPGKDYQIDRIDNTKGYFRENCRWVTKFQQAANRRKTKSRTSSQYVGVSFHKRDCYWYSYIQIEKRMTYIGCKFNTGEEAKEARNNYILANNLIDQGFALQ